MRLNRRFLSTLLALCMVMSLAVPASAAKLSATYGKAVYSDIGIMTYSRMLEVQNGVFPVANEEGLCALVDTNGKAVTAYEYDYISILGGGYFKVVGGESGYEEGIIDSTGKVIRELSDCTVYEKGNAICIATYVEDQGYVYEYFDLSMKPTSESVSRENGLIPTVLTVYDECWESNGYYFVGNYTEDSYEMGLFDANCSVVFPVGQYSGIDVVEIEGDVAFMVNTDDGAALLNEKRETVIAAGTYDSIWYDAWEDNFITVTSGDLYGAVDTNGKLIVSLGEYDEICNVNEDGYISALSYDGYGSNITNMVTKLFKNGAEVKTYEGKMVETVEYSDNFIFSTGAAVGMMDMSGKVILEEKYADIGGVVEDDVCTGELITRVREENSWNYLYGLYNADGKQLLEEKYSYLSYIADGKYKAQSNDKYGIITCTGETVIPFNYSQIDIAASAVAGLYDGTNYSLADLKGTVIVPATSEQITIFGGFNVAGVNGLRAEAERYEGYTDAIYPVNYKAADGWKTVYIDFADGSVLAKIDQRVSNINEDGYFVYQTENGLYGIGKATLSDDPTPVEPAPKPTLPTVFTDVPAGEYFVEPVKWAVERKITNGTSATEFSPNDTCTTAQILTFLYRSQGEPAVSIANPFGDVAETDYFYNAALWAYEKGLVEGGTFGGSTPCTRMSTVTYLWKLSGEPAPTTENKFTDVDAPAVTWAVEAGVTKGTSDTTFTPEQTCTRGQIVTFLYRYAQ